MKILHEDLNSVMKNMAELAESGLDRASNIGADATKIATSASFQKKLVVENKQFALANSVEVQNFQIIVHRDQKKGSSSINTDKKEALGQAIADAHDLAGFSIEDENLNFPDAKAAPKSNQLEFMYDNDVGNMELEELQESMQEVLSALTENPKIAIDRFEMGIDLSSHGLLNSRGVRQSEVQSMISWSWMGMAVDGDEVTGFDYDYNFSFGKEGFVEKAKQGAHEFTDRLLGFLKPQKAPSYKGPILLTPRAVQSILTNNILYHASGRAVMDGKSRWEKTVGKKVISDKISVHDMPHGAQFMGATSFDSDGMRTTPTQILKDGVLSTHLHDCYSAYKVGATSTGTAGGPFGIQIAAGKQSLEEMLNGRDELLVADRFAGNSDPIKGDFSGVAKSSRLYKKGKDAGPVNETMIAGNFFDLADHVIAVSKETRLVNGSFESPWILVDGVSVTGK